LARYAAVQFMYQIDVLGENGPGCLDGFVEHYISGDEEFKSMNASLFNRLVRNFSESVDVLEIIREHLNGGKDISNAPMINVSVMKAAVLEMIFEKTDIPVIINEYVEIAKNFADMNSVKFINAILDKVAKHVERR
jgi:N utilization substance protein B